MKKKSNMSGEDNDSYADFHNSRAPYKWDFIDKALIFGSMALVGTLLIKPAWEYQNKQLDQFQALDDGKLQIQTIQGDDLGVQAVMPTTFKFDGSFGTVMDPQTGGLIINFQPKDPTAFQAAFQRSSSVPVPDVAAQEQSKTKR